MLHRSLSILKIAGSKAGTKVFKALISCSKEVDLCPSALPLVRFGLANSRGFRLSRILLWNAFVTLLRQSRSRNVVHLLLLDNSTLMGMLLWQFAQ